MADPVHALAHDHADLNRSVRALGTQIRAAVDGHGSSSDLAGPLGELREHLFLHFAREEEGLFPFVTQNAPEVGHQIHAMEIAHDTICGALARMYHLACSAAAPFAIAQVFDRFEKAYAAHARAEAELFDDLDRRLDAQQRARLAEVVAGV